MVNPVVTFIENLNIDILNQGITELETKYNLLKNNDILQSNESLNSSTSNTEIEINQKSESKELYLLEVNSSVPDDTRKELFSILSDLLSLNRIQIKKKILTELPFFIKKSQNLDELKILKTKLEELGAKIELK